MTNSDIRHISLNLHFTETRVGVLMEQCAPYQGKIEISKDAILTLLKHNIEKIRQNSRTFTEGKILIYLPNKYARNALEVLLVDRGGNPETSFNKGILVMRLIDLVAINIFNEADIVAVLITAAQTANINNRNVNLTRIL